MLAARGEHEKRLGFRGEALTAVEQQLAQALAQGGAARLAGRAHGDAALFQEPHEPLHMRALAGPVYSLERYELASHALAPSRLLIFCHGPVVLGQAARELMRPVALRDEVERVARGRRERRRERREPGHGYRCGRQPRPGVGVPGSVREQVGPAQIAVERLPHDRR